MGLVDMRSSWRWGHNVAGVLTDEGAPREMPWKCWGDAATSEGSTGRHRERLRPLQSPRPHLGLGLRASSMEHSVRSCVTGALAGECRWPGDTMSGWRGPSHPGNAGDPGLACRGGTELAQCPLRGRGHRSINLAGLPTQTVCGWDTPSRSTAPHPLSPKTVDSVQGWQGCEWGPSPPNAMTAPPVPSLVAGVTERHRIGDLQSSVTCGICHG